MEYLIGSLFTIAAFWSIKKLTKNVTSGQIESVRYSQSHIYDLIRPFMPSNEELIGDPPPSQKTNHYNSLFIKVMLVDNEAFWIKDNQVYVADISDGAIDKTSTRQVDTMAMDEVQLKKMMFIIDQLKQDDNRHKAA